MKKTLLLSLVAVTCAGTAMAEIKTPQIYPGASFQRISANSKIALSSVYGTVVVYNLEDGTTTEYLQDYESEENKSYSLGLGNCITADGSLFVGSSTEDNKAEYCLNGEWFMLNVPDEEKSNLSNGVTPDGSRICGPVGLHNMTFEEVIMQVPAYWDRNADGTYGDAQVLPYPTKDLYGETPQYVTAISISDDGKTIVGQMVFCSGDMAIPVLYKQAADGKWSYSLPTKDLFNPDKIEAVPNPGDGPEGPSYESYMTQAEIDAYYEAINEYNQAGDYSLPYPEYEDYMTEQEITDYTAAKEAYQAEYSEWEEKWYAYLEYTEAVKAASPNFLFNNMFLTPDGKTIVGTLESEDPNADPWSWFRSSIYTPCSVDVATGTLTKVDTELSLLASGIADGGVIWAYNGQSSIPMTGYMIKDGEVKTLEEYLTGVNPEYGAWIKKNLTHEVVTGYDPDTYEDIIEEVTYTGMPVSSPDMSIITIWNNCPWWDYVYMAEGTIFYVSENSGVAAVSLDRKDMVLGKDGSLYVPEGYVTLEVYNVGGVCVKSITNPVGTVSLGLGSGIYLAKGTHEDGSKTLVKICK